MVRRWWEPNPETMLEDLLAAASTGSRRTRKGDKRPLWQVAALQAARRANLEARRQAALERSVARQEAAKVRRATHPVEGERWRDKLLRAMAPGEWYGAGDLARLVEAPRYVRWKVRLELWPAGLIERAANPAYVANELLSFTGAREPRWLWRLTSAGVAEVKRIRALALGRLDGGEQS